ncbi:hexokinase [Desulforamulus putei]|uniref:hexokinase n=1 Tax=Desulforamulus putei DSM 12395 TaxID=1121429 RepID=A0A1M4S9Q5_9FIRM|nr:hexokinase [Desulforamulus putei]SHE28912.1 hexokinase [Desulforamulus putei DSM 12395]
MTKVLAEKLRGIEEVFWLSASDIWDIAMKFKKEISEGLSGKSSLKMLPTFLQAPDGGETGTFLAIDFGGTNIRLQLVELIGQGRFAIRKQQSFLLKDPSGAYDYTSQDATAEVLFDFIAKQIANLLEHAAACPLGLTFSFPCRQIEANRAVLLNWTKGFKTSGVEGQEITGLLEKALAKKGLHNVNPVAIINDTTGTLLTAAYCNPCADIGSICGTGHNTCYLEPNEPPMIINMESGNFNKFPLTVYDRSLDRASEKPGEQLLEKAVSGRYIGEIARFILQDMARQGLLFQEKKPGFVSTANGISAGDLALMLADDTPDLIHISHWLKINGNMITSTPEERQALKTIASLVTTRSARLIGATYVGILQHVDPELTQQHVIGVDGSLFEKMPGYRTKVREVLQEIYQDKADRISLALTKNGSGIGAAIAAATCTGKRN